MVPVLAPPEDGRLVQGAVGAQADLRDPLGQIGHGLLQDAQVPAARGDMAIAELVMQDDILLRPEHHDRLVAPRPVVGHGRRVLVALHEGGVHIQGGRPFPGPALEAGDQRAIRAAQPGQRARTPGGSSPAGPAAHRGPSSTWKASRKSRMVVAAGSGCPSSVANA